MSMDKVIAVKEINKIRQALKGEGKRIVFTNGCFDIIHRGHVEYLEKAKAFGDVLIIGVNSDVSMQMIKGHKRPIIPLEDRLYILAHLSFVDFLVPFDEETPELLIRAVVPDVLVKGGDYSEDEIVGAAFVKAYGGSVKIIPFIEGKSTSMLIEEIVKRYGKEEYGKDTHRRG